MFSELFVSANGKRDRMGVKTNAGGGASVGTLKNALQYADDELGITVATSSYGEICDALADFFPEIPDTYYIYNVGRNYTTWASNYALRQNTAVSATWQQQENQLYCNDPWTGSAVYSTYVSVPIDVSHYSTFHCFWASGTKTGHYKFSVASVNTIRVCLASGQEGDGAHYHYICLSNEPSWFYSNAINQSSSMVYAGGTSMAVTQIYFTK